MALFRGGARFSLTGAFCRSRPTVECSELRGGVITRYLLWLVGQPGGPKSGMGGNGPGSQQGHGEVAQEETDPARSNRVARVVWVLATVAMATNLRDISSSAHVDCTNLRRLQIACACDLRCDSCNLRSRVQPSWPWVGISQKSIRLRTRKISMLTFSTTPTNSGCMVRPSVHSSGSLGDPADSRVTGQRAPRALFAFRTARGWFPGVVLCVKDREKVQEQGLEFYHHSWHPHAGPHKRRSR
jgi:hypothetical protein